MSQLVSYNDVLGLSVGTAVNYKEYSLDRHEKRHVQLEYETIPIEAIIPGGQSLNRDTLIAYLGAELSDEEYLIHSTSNYHRVVLKYTEPSTEKVQYFMIFLNPYFMDSHQQELFVSIDKVEKPIPNYNKVLGFTDYDFGGLKK